MTSRITKPNKFSRQTKSQALSVSVFRMGLPLLPKVVPASGLETDDTMTKPKPSFSPRWISTSYGCREAGTTALPLPPPPPLPMPLVDPLPELTVLREFWLPCGVRLPSVRLGAWVLLWWEEAGDGGTSPSPFDTGVEESEDISLTQRNLCEVLDLSFARSHMEKFKGRF